ncbi:MAG: GntR family transcriptional regulator, partial [Cycloclasticus sp.]|nr:GntR family transcriptional regulator [Cycloclasticus sp.]MBQ0790402.1 GntR family transcriptional regulator [Cycloclasticus sp.]
MVKLGNTHQLRVSKAVDFGFYLDAHELGDVLLPKKFAPKDLAIGDLLYVFLYLDSEDRPIATTQQPKAKVGEFAFLKAVARTHVGAFLDWGLDKDILV